MHFRQKIISVSLIFFIVLLYFFLPKVTCSVNSVEHVQLVSDSQQINCENPNGLLIENTTHIFWKEGNKTKYWTNKSGVGRIFTLFVQEFLQSHDEIVFGSKIFAVSSYFNGLEYKIDLKTQEISDGKWTSST